jgi:hypothetical protein
MPARDVDMRALARAAALVAASGAALFLACSSAPPGGGGNTVVAPVRTAGPAAPASTTGRIACGAAWCKAGSELCCGGRSPRCVALPAPSAAVKGGGSQTAAVGAMDAWRLCGRQDFQLCDDGGDCAEGQVCCSERELVDDESDFSYKACLPGRPGKVSCTYEEACSDDNPTCLRKDNVCGGEGLSPGSCRIPARLRHKVVCGSGPCADGMTCVQTDDGRACVPGIKRFPADFGVIECERGKDCGEDESCYNNPQAPGYRCDFSLAGVDGLSESAQCQDATDCVAFCRRDGSLPSCYENPETRARRCECLARCTKDEECGPCEAILIPRGAGLDASEAFCDKARGACDCRVPKKAP